MNNDLVPMKPDEAVRELAKPKAKWRRVLTFGMVVVGIFSFLWHFYPGWRFFPGESTVQTAFFVAVSIACAVPLFLILDWGYSKVERQLSKELQWLLPCMLTAAFAACVLLFVQEWQRAQRREDQRAKSEKEQADYFAQLARDQSNREAAERLRTAHRQAIRAHNEVLYEKLKKFVERFPHIELKYDALDSLTYKGNWEYMTRSFRHHNERLAEKDRNSMLDFLERSIRTDSFYKTEMGEAVDTLNKWDFSLE